MSPELTHATAHVNGIRMHYVEAGDGPPVILLHGFPETWFAWRHQIPFLAEHYRVIVPDLRGYGSTDKPSTGYDKRNMARDIRELMRSLGIERCPILGHDRGARVGLRFAKDYPEATERFAALDNIPTRTIFTRMDAKIAKLHWFFIFNNVPDLPEALITGREEVWLRFIFSQWCFNPELFSDEEIREYVKAFHQPGALKGAFDDYRAGPEDVAQDEADKDSKVTCPVLVLWGEDFIAGGKLWDFRKIWSEYATDAQFVSIPQCGHLPHEERPEIVNEALLRFLRG